MNTPLIGVCVLIALGLVVVVLDHLPIGTERYTISIRDLPNTAANLQSSPQTASTRR